MAAVAGDVGRIQAQLASAAHLALLGHKEKDHLVDATHYKRVYRKAGWISPTLLVDGRILGVWSQEGSGHHLRVEVNAFRPLPPAVRMELEAEVRGLSRFLGTESSEVTMASGADS